MTLFHHSNNNEVKPWGGPIQGRYAAKRVKPFKTGAEQDFTRKGYSILKERKIWAIKESKVEKGYGSYSNKKDGVHHPEVILLQV